MVMFKKQEDKTGLLLSSPLSYRANGGSLFCDWIGSVVKSLPETVAYQLVNCIVGGQA